MNTNSHDRKKGSVLVVVIIAMMAVTLLGTAILSMATSSRYEYLNLGITNRAYYLAESGASYVRAIRAVDRNVMPSGTYTFENGDQFVVVTSTNGGLVYVESTGIVNPGTHLESRQLVHFVINERGAFSDQLPLGFDFDDDGDFDEDLWSSVNLDPRITDTGPSGGQTALDLKGEEGQIYLTWQNNPDLDFTRVWGFNHGLLNYDVQVKIQPFETGNQQAYSKHYMLGISFRLHPDTNRCYGLSYFRSWPEPPNQTPDWVNALPASFQNLRGTNLYAVLWYRLGSYVELLNYRQLTPAHGVLVWRDDQYELADYATLLLQLDEHFASPGVRENLIAAYIQGPSVYPLWPDGSSTNSLWQEETSVFPAQLVWQDGTQTNIDDRITSADFNIIKPSEVGIHVFYDQTGANKKFFDDFALRMEGFAASSGGVQIQY